MKIVTNQKEYHASVRAYDENCIGCKNNNSDVMLSVQIGNIREPHPTSSMFNDIFMTNEEALAISDEIQKQVKQNKETK